MAALDFPASPTIGQTYTANGLTYTWDGTSWDTTNPTPVGNATGTLAVANGGTGQTTYTNGQLLIGNTTGNTLTKATLTQGTGITITNGAGSITIAASSAGTVTSVGGTGTVSGLTLTGTVTTSGNLTLGGNLTIAADMIYDNFTATASQTTFTTSTTYTSGKINVYANGVRMVNGSDVTVTSGTQVVFATGLAAGTNVNLVYPT